MKILVTGAAGFIGSHLCERLLKDSENRIIGVDTFIGPTPINLKEVNLQSLKNHPRFQFMEIDLLTADLENVLKEVDAIYHLAGMPGVRSSWGKDFDPYVTNNILATQRLLEVVKNKNLTKFIFASTSSIYGEKSGKVSEDSIPAPLSPYGITKLTGEHLCQVYNKSFGVPIVVVRFFTVYGPRQRPDMAFHRFIAQILKEEPLTIYGDGTQSRDFTFISDCVEATSAVLYQDHLIGRTINIGGKERASVNEIIKILEQIAGKKAKINYTQKVNGEPKHTWADITLAQTLLNYNPKISLKEGLVKELNYIRKVYDL
ncbi:NAD-dependent epimerase/dehydratase family protein [Metabacillus halosaccharovorans]|uniref:NAD-dependent epimerase/dehydratase family protein n=1 Tax=Metabacillus halosaccharovorans TaxID=930124 RepID=UPI00203D04B5|nr:NAD-dependent epimerase/dehydratase family protein [Metabacillus halosaccharovorans]MCM3440433.1 NAD-dependent epimerase/dehydratase family protein [Metabacillus halosaccharovorans]